MLGYIKKNLFHKSIKLNDDRMQMSNILSIIRKLVVCRQYIISAFNFLIDQSYSILNKCVC